MNNHFVYTLFLSLFLLFSLPQSIVADSFIWDQNEYTLPILVDAHEDKSVLRAISHLQFDSEQISGVTPPIVNAITAKRMVIIGSIKTSHYIKKMLKSGKLDASELEGKREQFLIQTIEKPLEGIDEAIVIVGSDKQGTIYGIYELSTQISVSP